MRRVLIISNNTSAYSGCHYYRAKLPAKYLNRLDEWQVDIVTSLPTAKAKGSDGKEFIGLDESKLDKYDVIVLQRYYGDHPSIWVGLVEWAKEVGKLVVYEFDDYMIDIPSHNPVASVVMDHSIQKLIQYFLHNSKIKTVASPALKEKFEGELCPNSLDFELWDKVLDIKPKKRDKITIGYAGGASHMRDLAMVEPVLNKLKDDIHVVVMGIDPMWTTIDYEFHPYIKTERYPLKLRKLGIDIGICPLEDNEFNKYKSNLKWLEYSAMQVPTIASDVRPYYTINHGTTGYLCKTQEDWEEYLTLLITNTKLRKRIGRQAYNFVHKKFNIENNIKSWQDAYSK